MTFELATGGSSYEQPEYLRAVAAHAGADIVLASTGGAVLPLLAGQDGILRTVDGLPRPYALDGACTVGELARELTEPGVHLIATLSPIGSGPELARELSVRGARLTGERPIRIAPLRPRAPREGFDAEISRTIATSELRGSTVEVGRLEAWFGPFHRAASAANGADPTDSFSDDYFEALATLDHYVVTVYDEHGVAAAALFLADGHEAHYHLGGLRVAPEPIAGTIGLALTGGIVEAHRTGCAVAVLGGRRSDGGDEPLFALPRHFDTITLPSFAVQVGLEGQ